LGEARVNHGTQHGHETANNQQRSNVIKPRERIDYGLVFLLKLLLGEFA
jgi:hypothetical protein